MRILPVTPEVWPAVADLFAEGGDPKWCACMYWRVRGLDWTNSTAETNRSAMAAAVEAAAVDGSPAPGLAALDDDDDVQNVYANFDISDEILKKLTAA